MTRYTSRHTLEVVEDQDTFLLDGKPTCDFCFEKGVRYEFEIKTTKSKTNLYSSVWAKYNNINDDFYIGANQDQRKYDLFEFQSITRYDEDDWLFFRYTPRTIGGLENFGSISEFEDMSIMEFDDFEFYDWLTGQRIKGEESGTRALIDCIATFCDPCDQLIVAAKIKEKRGGDFKWDEKIKIETVSESEIMDRLREQEYRFAKNPDFFRKVAEETIQNPYIHVSKSTYEDIRCSIMYKFRTFPESISLKSKSYVQEQTEFAACIERKFHTMTLVYSPDLFCQWNDMWDDMLDEKLKKMSYFPYFDFLTGNKIIGENSGSSAYVEKVYPKSNQNGERFWVVSLVNMVGDFQPNERIEIDGVQKQKIIDKLLALNPDLQSIPDFQNFLQQVAKYPFRTTSYRDNMIMANFFNVLENNYRFSTGFLNNRIRIDSDEYEFNFRYDKDTSVLCEDKKCQFFPQDVAIPSVTFLNEFFKDTVFQAKSNLVPWAQNNGADTGNTIVMEVPPEENINEIYINLDDYSMKPLRICIEETSLNASDLNILSYISEEVRCEYPLFEKFMRYYFAYQNRKGGSKYILRNLSRLGDIDTIPREFLGNFVNSYMPEFSKYPDIIQNRLLLKELLNFYKDMNSDEASAFLIKTLFGEDSKIKNKCNQNVFRTFSPDDFRFKKYLHTRSIGSTLGDYYGYTIADMTTSIRDGHIITLGEYMKNYKLDIDKFIGQTIRGTESRSTAIIENADVFENETVYHYRLELSSETGSFRSDEKLEIVTSDGQINYLEILNPDDVRYHINGFEEQLERSNVFLTASRGLLNRVIVDRYEGDWKLYDKVYLVSGTNEIQDGVIRVGKIRDGRPVSLQSIMIDGGNYNFKDGVEIEFVKYGAGGEITGRIFGRPVVGSIEFGEREIMSRNSFTNENVTFSQCETHWDIFTLCTPVSRAEYEEIYFSTIHEAGSYMKSVYPVDLVLECDKKDTAFVKSEIEIIR